jgi:eukaryotic-like serine/threonine-protein kinase
MNLGSKRMPSLEGTSLGRYRLGHRLGRGGMSEVYLATDDLMNREVAVKVVSSTHTDYIERFQREAEAIGRLQHDHILPAYDLGEQPPWHYLVMPYIAYGTLHDVLEKGPMSLEYAGELLEQIASGLQFAHDKGMIHRDIKPSNILLRDDHYAYLADFGLAKALDDPGKVTQTGVLLGTPEYMAPELADGPATKSSDTYSLGILLYQMVTGKIPFSGDTSLIVYLKQMREQPIQPSRVNPGIPHAIDVVIMRALEKDPRRRYETPMALAQAYARALHETQTQPLPLDQSRTADSGATAFDMPANPPPRRNDAVPPTSSPPVAPPPVLPMEPIMPLARPQQPEKLILPLVPSDALTARRQAPPARIGGNARPTPVYPRDADRRRVPARRENRNSLIGLSVLIGLLFIILTGVVYYAVANHTNNNHGTNNKATTTVGGSATAASTLSPSPTSNPSPTPDFGATATAVTGQTPSLTDNLSSDTNGSWNNDGQACAFQNGTYHVLVNQANFLQPCANTKFTMNNGAIKVDLSLLRGSDAGIIYSESSDQFYDFEITSQGKFFFRRHDTNGGGNYVSLISAINTPAIAPGSATNTLLMIVNNGDFTFFINGVFVGRAKDSNYHTGQIGFVAGTLSPVTSADASFSNLAVYPLA